MSRGFYNPQMGYWETNTSDVDDALIEQYPPGTVETPPRPDNMSEYNGTEWVKIEPSTNPKDYTLTSVEFLTALQILGVDLETIEPAIKDALSDDILARSEVVAKWRVLTTIKRDNATIKLLQPVFGLTDKQIDKAWMDAVARRTASGN